MKIAKMAEGKIIHTLCFSFYSRPVAVMYIVDSKQGYRHKLECKMDLGLRYGFPLMRTPVTKLADKVFYRGFNRMGVRAPVRSGAHQC